MAGPGNVRMTDEQLQRFYDRPDFDPSLLDDEEKQRLVKLTDTVKPVDTVNTVPEQKPKRGFLGDVAAGAWNQGAGILSGIKEIGGALGDIKTNIMDSPSTAMATLKGFGQGAAEGVKSFKDDPLAAQENFTGVRLAGNETPGEKVGATLTNVAAMLLPGATRAAGRVVRNSGRAAGKAGGVLRGVEAYADAAGREVPVPAPDRGAPKAFRVDPAERRVQNKGPEGMFDRRAYNKPRDWDVAGENVDPQYDALVEQLTNNEPTSVMKPFVHDDVSRAQQAFVEERRNMRARGETPPEIPQTDWENLPNMVSDDPHAGIRNVDPELEATISQGGDSALAEELGNLADQWSELGINPDSFLEPASPETITRIGTEKGLPHSEVKGLADTQRFGPDQPETLAELRRMGGADEAARDPRVRAVSKEIGQPIDRKAIQDITGEPSSIPFEREGRELDSTFRRLLEDERGMANVGDAWKWMKEKFGGVEPEANSIAKDPLAMKEGPMDRRQFFYRASGTPTELARTKVGKLLGEAKQLPENAVNRMDKLGKVQDRLMKEPETDARIAREDTIHDAKSGYEQQIWDHMFDKVGEADNIALQKGLRTPDHDFNEAIMDRAMEIEGEMNLPTDLVYNRSSADELYGTLEQMAELERDVKQPRAGWLTRGLEEAEKETKSAFTEGMKGRFGNRPKPKPGLPNRSFWDESGGASLDMLKDVGSGLNQLRVGAMLSGLALPKSILGNMGAPFTAAIERGSMAPLKEVFGNLPENYGNFKTAWRETANPKDIGGSGPLNVPGRLMGALDETTQKALERAGLSPDEAQRLLLTRPHPLGHGRFADWMQSTPGKALYPFSRTPFNSLIEGYSGENFGSTGKNLASAGAVAAGTLLPEDWKKDKKIMGLLSAALGPRGVPFLTAAAMTGGGKKSIEGISPMPEWGLPSDFEDLLRMTGLYEPAFFRAYINDDDDGRSERNPRSRSGSRGGR